MADITVNVVDGTVVVQPFGAEALLPIVAVASGHADAAADSAADAQDVADYIAANYSDLIVNTAGPISPTATGTSSVNTAAYFWPSSQQTYDQFLTTFELGVQSAGTFVVHVAKVEGDGSLTTYSQTKIGMAAGAASRAFTGIYVPAGHIVGFQRISGAFYFDNATIPGGESLWQTAAAPTTSTAKTTSTTLSVHARFTLVGSTKGRAKYAYEEWLGASALLGTALTIGESGVVNTGSNAPAYTIFPETAAPADGILDQIEIAVNAATSVDVLVGTINTTTGAVAVTSSTAVTLAAGYNKITLPNIEVPSGSFVGVRGSGVKFTNPSASGLRTWIKAALIGASDNLTISTIRFEVAFRVKTALVGQGLQGVAALTLAESLEATIGSVSTAGAAVPVATGTTVANNYSIITPDAATASGTWTKAVIGAAAAGTAELKVLTIDGSNVATVVSSVTVPIAAGVNTLTPNITFEAGQYLAVCSGQIKFNAADGTRFRYYNGGGSASVATGNTVNAATGTFFRFEVGFETKTGLLASSGGSSNNAGLDTLASADNTGATDIASTLSTVLGSHPQPYLRPGIYTATTIQARGAGLWGPGKLYAAGERFFVPSRPMRGNMADRLRAALLEHIAAGDVLTLIGDSIACNQNASAGAKHWFNMLTRFVNYGVAADEPGMTALVTHSGYAPTFYGLTVTGGTTGTRGPLNECLILAAGDSISFTGAYEQVDVFYTQQPGAGSLAFAYNGGAAYKTVSCAGTLTTDVFSGPSLTGQAASGTYTITATGGPVEITGLIRLAVKASSSTQARRRLRTIRAAHGGYQFGNFGAAARASIIKQGQYAGGKCVPLIALGHNDGVNNAPATIVTNATAMLDDFAAAGCDRVFAVIPYRPANDASWTTRDYDSAIGTLLRLYRQRDVIVLGMSNADWNAEGLLTDTVHPGDEGNDRYAQEIVEALAFRAWAAL